MNLDLHKSWQPLLQKEFDKPYFMALSSFIDEEYREHVCFPPKSDIFNAFKYCHIDTIKVVIIGQDPYHGFGQAHGLSFSVKNGIKHPPSLINIFKELQQDLGVSYPVSGSLIHWAKQGVLLLNASLTVRSSEAGSHQNKGWETFTDSVIETISLCKEDIVFLLWGGFAIKKSKLIDTSKHHILTSGHPSPLSANRGYWYGNKHFSKTNSLLEQDGKSVVVW